MIGSVEPFGPLSITDAVTEVTPPVGPWLSVSVTNDGPYDVFVKMNKNISPDLWYELPPRDIYTITLRAHKLCDVSIKCGAGQNAVVRVVCLR